MMENNSFLLSELARMSQTAGARVDYVQGGGGNTSVKLGNGLMAIKASGYRLSQVTSGDGFAVVETATLNDVTAAEGYNPLRPSVEVGFHALLGKYVLHTHPVYVNLALCSAEGMRKLGSIAGGIEYAAVPYINPGEELSRAVAAQLKPDTQIVFMQNHGVVVTADTADECLRIHDELNERAAALYGVSGDDFSSFYSTIMKTLYPDQQVYLTLSETQQEILAAVMFIQFTLAKNGGRVQAMDEQAMDFIANWESEAYRKSVLS